jgi:hypothetical protein
MKTAVDSEGPEFYRKQRKLIDIAYRVDSDLASSLASMADKDEARLEARRNLKQQLNLNKLKNSMIERTKLEDEDAQTNEIDYSRAAWKLLSSLNSGRIETLNMNEIKDYIVIASKSPITRSYPILAWITENCIRRYSNTDQASTYIRPIFEAIVLGSELSLKIAEKSANSLKRKRPEEKSKKKNIGFVIKPGDRESVLLYIKEWIEENVKDYLIICDPFFGLSELVILRDIKSVKPKCKVYILSSKKHQIQQGIQSPWEESYLNYWRKNISDQEPPETEFIIIGTISQGETPIHDRWWLTKGSGLRLGSSYNSLGISKMSDISLLDWEEALTREDEINQYIRMSKREHNNERLVYTKFIL